ncbi:hypothetical protein THRCLA_11800 [Thraustotheca clavata]|uniref:RGS domain-containing protein n=1 Tax=Thraustotheca clavata TaxID=74557 RepID=A0A1V9Y6L9_9STRA|nr:hypothetical protein THRCLA_11800 [Thraustotheca clavata]
MLLTKRENRPFLATKTNTSPPRQPGINNVVLVGSQLITTPAIAPTASISATVLKSAEKLTSNEKNAVWSNFASQPLSPIIEAAYAELYPNTYLTSTSLKSKSVQELKNEPVVKNSGVIEQETKRQELGHKSYEISFWQAVEGFKSIRDEAIRGISLPPAKTRRKRRSIEIAHEFLASNGPLSWMAIEYPDLIEVVERGIQKDDVPLTLFDSLQAIIQERLIQKRSILEENI